jgi:uncharacterized protein
MRILVKDLTPEPLELTEIKDFAWLSDVLGGVQARPAPGATLEAKVRASKYSGNVFVEGEMHTEVMLVCSRCAAEWLEPTDFSFRLVLAPATPGGQAKEEDVELTRDDEGFSYYEGELIDVDGPLREQVILQIPEYPLCRADCRGLCQRCGGNLNEGACTCPPPGDSASPFAQLQKLKLAK